MEKLNGVVETHYSNGKLKSRETYEDGKLNGLFEDWQSNGQAVKSKLQRRQT